MSTPRWRRPVLPVIPGEPCPALRNGRHIDPAVTIDMRHSTRFTGVGTRTCGRCGRESVTVTQARGDHWTVWYYAPHLAPQPAPPSVQPF